MKMKRSSIFYLFVLVVIGSIYYFDYYKGEMTQVQKDKEAILLTIPKEDIAEIELQNADGVLTLVQSEKKWNLEKPVRDAADIGEMEGWLSSMVSEKSIEKLGEGENINWGTYGLDKPLATIVIKSKSGANQKIELSSRKNFEGNTFLRKNEEKVVYVGSATWVNLLGKSKKDLRDKRVIREGLEDIEGFSFRVWNAKPMVIDLKLESAKWLNPSHKEWILDQNAVREFVSKFKDLKAQEFVLETNPDTKQKSQYGLGTPRITFEFKLAGGGSWKGLLGQDKNKNWFFTSETNHRVFQVASPDVEAMLSTSLESLRDHEFPFVFDKEKVAKVILKSDRAIELTKVGQGWTGQGVEGLDESAVDRLIDQIRELRVAQFLEDRPIKPEFEKVNKSVKLLDAEGKSLFDLQLGETLNSKSPGALKEIQKGKNGSAGDDLHSQMSVYAKTSVYDHVVTLEGSVLNEIQTKNLFKPTTKEEAKSEHPQN